MAKKKIRTKKKISNKRKKATKKKTSKKAAKKPGLYANIHKAQARAKRGGRPVRRKGEKGAPTEAAFRSAKSKK